MDEMELAMKEGERSKERQREAWGGRGRGTERTRRASNI
jgi:hypothetical protein